MFMPYIDINETTQLSNFSKSTLKEIQRGLEIQCYNPGPLDGLYGSKTVAAWSDFQRAHELPEDSTVTVESAEVFNTVVSAIDAICQNIVDIKASIKELVYKLLPGQACQAHVAYVLATVDWETGNTWKPIEEYGKGAGYSYPPYYGRGYVQLTWDYNYTKYAAILRDNLIGDPDLACNQDIALLILVHGFLRGTFTGKKLTDYVHTDDIYDFVNARRCINGTDKAEKIANMAEGFM